MRGLLLLVSDGLESIFDKIRRSCHLKHHGLILLVSEQKHLAMEIRPLTSEAVACFGYVQKQPEADPLTARQGSMNVS
jgi:hypothetical protein